MKSDRVSSSFDDFIREMEEEARQDGPEAEAAFLESQQRHWIGRRLFERRHELGYTQARLATLSRINQADISKIEHAEANPTLDTLAALATALGLTLALQPLNEQVRALGVRRRPPETTNRTIDATADAGLKPAVTTTRAAAAKRPAPVRVRAGTRQAAAARIVRTSEEKRRRTG